jgi:hypothetical protein
MQAYSVLCNNIIAVSDKGMVVFQNRLGSQKDVPGLHSEPCASSSRTGVQAVHIKVEELSDIEGGKDPVTMTVVGIKAEHEVSSMYPLCPLLGISESHPELPVLILICICYTKLLQSREEVNS